MQLRHMCPSYLTQDIQKSCFSFQLFVYCLLFIPLFPSIMCFYPTQISHFTVHGLRTCHKSIVISTFGLSLTNFCCPHSFRYEMLMMAHVRMSGFDSLIITSTLLCISVSVQLVNQSVTCCKSLTHLLFGWLPCCSQKGFHYFQPYAIIQDIYFPCLVMRKRKKIIKYFVQMQLVWDRRGVHPNKYVIRDKTYQGQPLSSVFEDAFKTTYLLKLLPKKR